MIDGADGLDRLAADLLVAGSRAQAETYKATRVEANAMRDEWRQEVSGARGLPGLPAALSYDVLPDGLRGITAEVGYDDEGQGELGNIVEFGTSEQGPIRQAGPQVLEHGADRLERFLSGLDPL